MKFQLQFKDIGWLVEKGQYGSLKKQGFLISSMF